MKGNHSRWEKINKYWFWLGLLAVTVTVIPSLILGKDAIFTYHDQLDGEMIAYLLQAKHLFQGNRIPEFLGGVSKTALVPPAPLAVLLFFWGDGYAGLVLMMFTGKLAGYLGMYLICREAVKESWIAAVVGVLYALIPFLSVYGLSQFGIPLLFWCVLQLRKRRHVAWSFCYVALYTLSSSLVLVGFGLLGMGLALAVWELWRRRSKVKDNLGDSSLALPVAAWFLMLLLYVAENFRLLWQLLEGGEVSHKSEYVLNVFPFFTTLVEGLTLGGQHSEDYHIWLLAVAVLAAAAWLMKKKTEKRMLWGTHEGALLQTMGFCLCWNCFFALAAALWKSGPGICLRSSIAALGAFQLDRLLWIAPCLWYLMGACGIELVWGWLREHGRRVSGVCLGALTVAAVCVTGIRLLLAGDVKSNVQKLLNPDYSMLSFRDYYAIGVMEQIEEFLYLETGRKPEEYRVVSLGIDPAAALYHGFYCLDGYSNNYPLEYKHAFRRILAPELEKSEYLQAYYDDWGNRCYLLSSEIPGYYTVEKNGFWFQEYEIDSEALSELGGRYLFSAAYIADAESQGLMLLREEPFETEDSYYRIFLYEVTAEAVN